MLPHKSPTLPQMPSPMLRSSSDGEESDICTNSDIREDLEDLESDQVKIFIFIVIIFIDYFGMLGKEVPCKTS